MKYIYKISLFLIAVLFSHFSQATHLQGGEIRVAHAGGQTYKISVLIYFDMINGPGATVAQNNVQVCMGDGKVVTFERSSFEALPEGKGIYVGKYEGNYTYASFGTYQISAALENRNSGVLNLQNGDRYPMFIWTVLTTEVPNSTPVLPYLQFQAGVRQIFTVDLKPTDTEADSVSFRLQKLSKPSPGTCGVRSIDQEFIYPNDVSKSGTFKIDQTTRKLIWKAPEKIGSYLFAVVADEWRNGIKISETYREGTINVIDKPGETVEIPPYEEAESSAGTGPKPNPDSEKISIAIQAYPVPTDDFINVKVQSKNRSIITLQLIDLQGRILQQISSRSAEILFQEQFDVRDYASGIYLIRAENDTESVTQKIIR
ncbi:T9SS type A sorting domain-containing protein [Dyadobacter psychrotolerans]|uniref:T9SS type A sorting domain-containing protein n=1 Tax=Dyadobacter psychrotolerans TaxID=2541721 RepID=A0A4R5DSK2_9BACT|nr:T9SS type A sorting domain-containing protein [Dyadobacter psychrotolerans]TDE17456.1 T9SS type A sorting domain-containing protein [Dyadobacter psychrotolerans]